MSEKSISFENEKKPTDFEINHGSKGLSQWNYNYKSINLKYSNTEKISENQNHHSCNNDELLVRQIRGREKEEGRSWGEWGRESKLSVSGMKERISWSTYLLPLKC